MIHNKDVTFKKYLKDELNKGILDDYNEETRELIVDLMRHSYRSGWDAAINNIYYNA